MAGIRAVSAITCRLCLRAECLELQHVVESLVMPSLSPARLSSRCWPLTVAVLLAWLAGSAQAQVGGSAPAREPAVLIAEQSQAWLDQAVAAARPAGAAPLRMVVQVGALDSRLNLAPCAQVEPYLPPGVRLWGKTRIGLRCVDGVVRWNVFLPVQVQAFGQTWVMRSDVAPGNVLSPDDAVLAEVDWAHEDASVLADPDMWVGQTATRALRTGQTLRAGECSEAAALRFIDWMEPLLRRESYLALLLERPDVQRRLLRLLDLARWPMQYLMRHPGVIDELADARLMRGRDEVETGYPEAEMKGWADRARTWAGRGDVFVYFISGGKVRAPAAAEALAARLA